jgi:hypothetical protein
MLWGALLVFALGTAGCYEIHEEVWIRPDGTVRYAVDYAVPEYLLGALEMDGGNADTIAAEYARPAATVVDGDSVWNREYADGTLHHFVSVRRLGSIERLVTLPARQTERADLLKRKTATRDSLFAGDWSSGRATLDSITHDPYWNDPANKNPMMMLTGQLTGAYEAISHGAGQYRIRHTPAPFRKDAADDLGPAPGYEKQVKHGSQRRIFAGRTFSYRLHAPRIISTNGTSKEGGALAEWTLPMADAINDSMPVVLDAVIELKKGQR